MTSGGDILSTVTKAAGVGILLTQAADSPFGKKVINAGTDLAGDALSSIKTAYNNLTASGKAEAEAEAIQALTTNSNASMAKLEQDVDGFLGQTSGDDGRMRFT